MTWIKIGGTQYVEGCIVALDSSEIITIFGMIIDILLIENDAPYFVCEVMTTEEYSDHLHSFVLKRVSPTPIIFCKHQELADYHALGLYKLRLFEDSLPSLFVVPKYHIM